MSRNESTTDASKSEAQFSDFHRRMEQYITDADGFLNVPHGTIATTFSDPDFVFVIKMCGVVEPLLRKAVRENVRRTFEHPKVSTTGSESLLKAIGDLTIDRLRKILYEFGGIDAKTNAFISALFDIRHRYAHNIVNVPLSVVQLCEKIGSEPSGDKTLLRKLMCFSKDEASSALLTAHIRAIMYYNIAMFLGNAVHIAKPPPVPPEGLLGLAMKEIASGREETPDP